METTIRTESYQDPAEQAFEKRLSWTFVLFHSDNDASINVVADDMSGREVSLPAGVILEIAEAIQLQRALVN